MSFSATVTLGTVGTSITDVTLYPCTGSTSGTCSGTAIPGYSNKAKGSFPLTVTGITDGTTYIKLVAAGGGCTPDYMLQISGIPGAATLTPTPAATTPPTATPPATTPPTATPSALPYSQFTIYTDSSTAPTGYTSSEAACGGSGAAPQTVYVQGSYSNLSDAYTDGKSLFTTSALTSDAKFNGYGTWYKTTNQSDSGGSLRVDATGFIELYNTCPGPLTFSATTDSSTYGEYENEINGNNMVTVTVTTSRSAVGSYIWWSKHSGTADYSDFKNDHTSPMLITAATGHTFILVIDNIAEDTEGPETFSVGILTGTTSPPTAGGEVAYTPTFTIADDSIEPQYRYARLERFLDENGCSIPYSESNKDYYWDQQTNGSLDGANALYSGSGYCYRVDSFFNDVNLLAGKSEVSGATFNNCPSCPG